MYPVEARSWNFDEVMSKKKKKNAIRHEIRERERERESESERERERVTLPPLPPFVSQHKGFT